MLYTRFILAVIISFLCVLGKAQNVGIGVDTPQTKLHVAGTLMTDSLRLPNGAKNSLVLTSDSVGNGSWKPLLELTPRLATISETKIGQDPYEVVVSGNYAFVANHQIGEIRSFDVSGNSPIPLDTFDVPGPYPSRLGISGDVLVVLVGGMNDSLLTIDITNPDSLFKRDALFVDQSTIAGFTSGNTAAFLTFSSDELIVFDISNPDSIYQTGTLALDNPTDIEIVDTLAYITESNLNVLRLVSLADPAAPYIVSAVNLIEDFPSRVRVKNQFAYVTVLVNSAPDKFQIIDVSNPLAPQAMGSLTYGTQATHLDVVEPYAYVHDFVADSLVIIDISDKSQPVIAGHLYAGPQLLDMVADDQRIYYTENSLDVLRILSIGPTIPMLGSDGTFSSFDGTFEGHLEIRSPSHLDHLRLNRPGVGAIDLTIGAGFSNNEKHGLLVSADEEDLLFVRAQDGFFGIGTNSPQKKLHIIDGSISLTGLDNSDTNEGFLMGKNFLFPSFGFVYDGSLGEERAHIKHLEAFGDTTSLMTFHESHNVGVGRNTPEVKLDVGGSIRSVGGNVRIKDGLQELSLNANAADHYIHLNVGGTTHSNDDIILGDLSSASNKVGIGTSTPGSLISNTLLDVHGGHISLANNFGVFAAHSSGSGIGAGFDSGTDNELDLWAGGAARMRIQADGKAGIGTTAPSRDLTILDPDADGSTFMNLKDASREMLLGTNSSGASLRTLTNHDLSFWTNDSQRMTIDAGGKISLNTTTVRTMLTLRGPDHSDDGPIMYLFGNGSDQTESGRIRFVETTASTSWRGGFIHYDGSANEMYIGVHDTSDKLVANDVNAITIERSSGEVGIGTTNPTALLEVNATIVKKPGGGSWAASSDIRLKQDVHNYSDGLDEVLQIRAVRFRYNEKSKYDTSKEHVGVVAQELQEVTPHMVSTYEQNGEEYLEVDNSAMTYMLINAVQELASQNAALQQEIAQLRADLKQVAQISQE